MEFSELLKRRTIRLFRQEPLAAEDFRALIHAARLAPSASNKQRLRYIVVKEKELVEQILPNTAYAALMRPKRDPEPGKTAPVAFLVVQSSAEPSQHIYADAGAAIQSIEFAAWERGIGCCWLGSFKQEKIAEILSIEKPDQILYLVALGHPAESPVSEDIPEGASTDYYLDDTDTLHVPKYAIDAITTWR